MRYRSLYPGVDAVFYGGDDSAIEYDLVVAAGADPSAIRLSLEGASNTRLDAAGNIVLDTAAGAVTMRKPVVYQQESDGSRHKIDGRYLIAHSGGDGAIEVAFALNGRDPSRPVIIDPQISYSSYIGGTGDHGGITQGFDGFQVLSSNLPPNEVPTLADASLSVAGGSANRAYVAGLGYSTDFPAVAAFQSTNHGAAHFAPNAFVAGFDTSQSGAASLLFRYVLGR